MRRAGPVHPEGASVPAGQEELHLWSPECDGSSPRAWWLKRRNRLFWGTSLRFMAHLPAPLHSDPNPVQSAHSINSTSFDPDAGGIIYHHPFQRRQLNPRDERGAACPRPGQQWSWDPGPCLGRRCTEPLDAVAAGPNTHSALNWRMSGSSFS